MKTRVLTAVIGLPLLFAVIYFGGWWVVALVFALTLVGLREYVSAVNTRSRHPLNYTYLAVLSVLILVAMRMDFYALPFALAAALMLCFIYEIFSAAPSFTRAALSVFALLYLPVMFGFLMLFEHTIGGRLTIWMCFIAPFATDTFAYFGGRALGGKKLTPISPNKTVSGAVCGFLACALLMLLYGWFLQTWQNVPLPLYDYAVLGAVASIAGQIGDLSASLIKRTYGVKDFGKILPGHGGVLDRFDSILFIIPVIYTFTYYFFG